MSTAIPQNVDILIVGAGGCGLTAAVAAADEGARVLVLEKDREPGGSTAMSAAIFVAAGSRWQKAAGMEATAAALAGDILRLNGGESDPTVTTALCRLSGALMDWLAAQGVPLEHLPGYRYAGMTGDWIHATPGRHGAELIAGLSAAAALRPSLSLQFGTGVTGLLTEGGTVRGVTALLPDGRSVAVPARRVILAAAGFGANPRLVRHYLQPMAGALYYGGRHATGDAISWARELGAATDAMSAYQPHSSVAVPAGPQQEPVLVTAYLLNSGAIQVNADGHRFGDETDAYGQHALAIQQQPGRTVVEIFDERIYRQALANYARFEDAVRAGILRRAANLATLAAHFELDAAALEQTVAAYNEAVHGGSDAFGRTKFGKPLAPPYWGVRVTSALVQTLGGLRVDEHARVLRNDGTPIANLYAGGGTAAGLAGSRPEGYLAGTGLLAAFGLGFLAGRHAARSLKEPAAEK